MKSIPQIMPSQEQIQEIQSAVNSILPPSDLADWFRSYAKNHSLRLAQDLAMIESLPNTKDILEVGSLPPILFKAMEARGLQPIGLDIAPDRFKVSLRESDVRRCNIELEAMPVADESMDLVVLNEVFEHLRIDLIFTMSECLRVLKPGGTLILSTPNLLSAKGYWALLKKGQSAHVCPSVYDEWMKIQTLGHMGHVREYTAKDVQDFLSRVGFAPYQVMFRGGDQSRFRRFYSLLPESMRPFMSIYSRKPLS